MTTISNAEAGSAVRAKLNNTGLRLNNLVATAAGKSLTIGAMQ